MGFGPIDEELEIVLVKLIDKADSDMTRYIEVDFEIPEIKELNKLGFFDEYDEYMSGISLRLSYQAVKYFDRKATWEEEQSGQAKPDGFAKSLAREAARGFGEGTGKVAANTILNGGNPPQAF